jgi:hydrogenase maturation factor
VDAAAESAYRCDTGSGCITCSDEAVEMAVRGIDEARGLALCEDAAGARHTVETALVEPVGDGDVLLVHAGTAIQALGREVS